MMSIELINRINQIIEERGEKSALSILQKGTVVLTPAPKQNDQTRQVYVGITRRSKKEEKRSGPQATSDEPPETHCLR
jgi:hypothetical protein